MSVGNEAGAAAILTRDGAVATITLNRPDAFNAINMEMAIALRDLATKVTRDDSIHAVIIKGNGAAFCGGGDIRYFVANLENIGPSIRELLTVYHEFIRLLVRMPKITVAAVHGSAAGAGFSLAAMCDLCVAEESVKFIPAYSRLGVSPDGGGTYGLSRAVGPRRALQIFLAEDVLTAEKALEWGLASKLVPTGELEDGARAYVERLLRTSPETIEATKRLLRQTMSVDIHDHLIDETESLIRTMATDLFRGSIEKFVKKG